MRHVIAIDIGGTKTIGSLFDEDKNIIEEKRFPTNPKAGPENLLNSLFSVIEEFLKEYTVDCISVGSAGRININDGSVFFASDNIPGWTGVRIKDILEERYHIPVVVENDCKVAGYGEEWNGSAQGLDNYICITLGTGVGAAVKSEGKMIHGSHYSAGELGHIILHPNGRQCNCGLKGCVEQYCSGTALTKIYNDKAEKKIETGYDFFELVRNKDELALSVLDGFVDDLFNVILTLTNSYDPDRIIIGGGLIDTREYWWDKLMEKVNGSAISKLFKVDVVPASLGNKAGIYGAAYLGFKTLDEMGR
ncbi:MAG: ROK family protein [Erysipelotrichaceae bacterium]|nr:ROK family protein [Erysipelotrichaceae bacterium]